jgi:hypothetical protein
LTVILNIAIVGTMNGLYLWSTLRDLSTNARIGIQFGFAFLTLLWSLAVRGFVDTKIKESQYGVWLFVILYLFNSVLIPCLVTALSSPSCYQRLLVEPHSITSTYLFQKCVNELIDLPESICVESSLTEMDPLKITPPFTYSYQCEATLLTSYIPVYFYSVSLQFISILMKLLMAFYSHPNHYPTFIFKTFPGVFWPLYWNKEATLSLPSVRIIRPSEIICITINHLILFLTFGLCSPVLGCYLLLFICANLCSWVLFVGRFLKLRLNVFHNNTARLSRSCDHQTLSSISNPMDDQIDEEENSANKLSSLQDEFIELLSSQLKPISTYIIVSKRPVVVTSGLFITLLCWEMVADAEGFDQALWVPLTGISMILLIWMIDRWLSQGIAAFPLITFLWNSLWFMKKQSLHPPDDEDPARMTVEFSRPSQASQYSPREFSESKSDCSNGELEGKG